MWLLPIQCEKWQKFPRDALIPACPCHFCTWKWCCWPFRCQQLRKVTISTTFDNSAPVLTHFWQCSSWLQINKSVDLGLLLLRCRCPPSHIHSGSKFPHKGTKKRSIRGWMTESEEIHKRPQTFIESGVGRWNAWVVTLLWTQENGKVELLMDSIDLCSVVARDSGI